MDWFPWGLLNLFGVITLSMVSQYALDNTLGDDTDIFTILSQMQLETKGENIPVISNSLPHPPSASDTDCGTLVEYSTEDLLNLLST